MNGRAIDFAKGDGLVPAIVQDADTGRVVMLGYMNQEALSRTQRTRMVTFFSRSRQTLWTKGETSGNYLELVDVAIDCDGDTLLVRARPHGPTCHTGAESCFDLVPDRVWQTLPEAVGGLARCMSDQKNALPPPVSTMNSIREELERIACCMSEPDSENARAAESEDKKTIIIDTGTLLRHILELLLRLNIPQDEVAAELWRKRK